MSRTRKRLSTDERRVQLLELGKDLFAGRSYDELSIDEIAAAAGISKGLLYHYFPSKRDYYVETVRAAAEEMLSLTLPATSLPPTEAMNAALEGYLTYVEDNALTYVTIMRGGVGVDVEIAAVLDHVRQTMIRRMCQGLGATEPLEPRLRVALRGWIGLVEAASLDWILHKDLTRPQLHAMLRGALGALLTTFMRQP